MDITSILIFTIILFVLEILYFKFADHFNIIDKPNSRSSHLEVTIRGGGIIFAFGALLFFFNKGFNYPYFILGLTLISIISFLDDIHTLNNKIRLTVQLLAVILLFIEWNLFDLPFYWLLIATVFVLATINAYNFMDGINGITGSYSLLTIGTLAYINYDIIAFTSNYFLIIIGLSLIVFNFFNFRIKAKCFAGDVGSISIAFIIIFLVGQLILKTENFAYIFLLLMYGLDTSTTVFFRKMRKENIFKAHRSHFYQYLVNYLHWPHLTVSILYFFTQLIINTLIVFLIKDNVILVVLLIILSTAIFIISRLIIEGKNRLLKIHID